MALPLTYARFPLVALVMPAGDRGAAAQLLGQVHPWDAGLRHEDSPGLGRGRAPLGLCGAGGRRGSTIVHSALGKSGLLMATVYHSITQC